MSTLNLRELGPRPISLDVEISTIDESGKERGCLWLLDLRGASRIALRVQKRQGIPS